jgi:hypothetical protein
MGAQSLVGAEEMRRLQSYLGPLDRLVGTGDHLACIVRLLALDDVMETGRRFMAATL